MSGPTCVRAGIFFMSPTQTQRTCSMVVGLPPLSLCYHVFSHYILLAVTVAQTVLMDTFCVFVFVSCALPKLKLHTCYDYVYNFHNDQKLIYTHTNTLCDILVL